MAAVGTLTACRCPFKFVVPALVACGTRAKVETVACVAVNVVGRRCAVGVLISLKNRRGFRANAGSYYFFLTLKRIGFATVPE